MSIPVPLSRGRSAQDGMKTADYWRRKRLTPTIAATPTARGHVMKDQVAKWLQSLHRTQSVRPCVVAIGKDTYEGAMYECVGEYVANMDAIVHGERRVGDIYIQRSIYLVGDVPAVVKERRRTCFTFEGQDWFLASHGDLRPVRAIHHYLPLDRRRQDRRRTAVSAGADDREARPLRMTPDAERN